MPKVGNKKYPYTTKGKAAAKRAAKKKAFVRSFRSEVVLDDFRGHAFWRMKQ